MKRRKVNGKFHPCTCDSYNGDQCYNCLNGAHNICEGETKCNRSRKKQGNVGVNLIFKSKK
jgi:hypothetical protein